MEKKDVIFLILVLGAGIVSCGGALWVVSGVGIAELIIMLPVVGFSWITAGIARAVLSWPRDLNESFACAMFAFVFPWMLVNLYLIGAYGFTLALVVSAAVFGVPIFYLWKAADWVSKVLDSTDKSGIQNPKKKR